MSLCKFFIYNGSDNWEFSVTNKNEFYFSRENTEGKLIEKNKIEAESTDELTVQKCISLIIEISVNPINVDSIIEIALKNLRQCRKKMM